MSDISSPMESSAGESAQGASAGAESSVTGSNSELSDSEAAASSDYGDKSGRSYYLDSGWFCQLLLVFLLRFLRYQRAVTLCLST